MNAWNPTQEGRRTLLWISCFHGIDWLAVTVICLTSTIHVSPRNSTEISPIFQLARQKAAKDVEKEAQKLQQELHANKAVRIQYKPRTKFGRSITSNSFLPSPIHRRNAENYAISFFHF